MEAHLKACGTDLQLCPQLTGVCGTDHQRCPELGKIDWSAPWLSAWRVIGERVAQQVLAGVPQPAALNQAVRVDSACPVRFVPQSELPVGQAYEQHIFETTCVPTREGLHDFFNGLAWLHHPLTKQHLNRLHMAQIEQSGIQPVRGPARDALTLFDENAALLQAPEPLWQALATKDWKVVFGALRPLWRDAQLLLFGHALLEKLVSPRKSITAHVFRVPQGATTWTDLDRWLAQDLSADKLAAKPFAHLPVLGVPGWWDANEDANFYADSSVFRPPRS